MPTPTESAAEIVTRIELLIRRDPGHRGLIGADGEGPGIGELLPAAQQLADRPGNVCLVTGFFVPDPESERGGNAETDGPPGTTLLASVLLELGYDVRIVTDENCGSVVRAAAEATGIPSDLVLTSPLKSETWRQEFRSTEFGRSLAHLIAIERVGPGHTLKSIRRVSPDDAGQFESLVPSADQNLCRNMRGEAIDQFTGDLHGLFEDDPALRPGTGTSTIGIGDGGNEIGMGRFSWRSLHSRLTGDRTACVPCRISTDRTIVAGTSNWGAMALAAAVAALKGRLEVLDRHSVEAHHGVVEAIVTEAGAVDGVTRRREATVDGLPFLTYAQPWVGIRRLVDVDN